MRLHVRLCGPPWIKLGLALALVLTVGMNNASAQLTDPQVAIGPGNGQDPVSLGQTSMVTVTNVGSGKEFNLNSWYLILGVANTGSTVGMTTSVQVTSVNGSSLSTPISGNYVTKMTSGEQAYGQLEAAQPTVFFPPTDASESFTNWLNGTNGGPGDLSLGINATSYSLFDYQINAPLLGGGTDTIGFNGDLPLGVYVIAYGVNSKHTFSTPFTNAGLETLPPSTPPPPPPVPAPAGLVLTLSGCGAFGMFSLLRRRKLIAHAAA